MTIATLAQFKDYARELTSDLDDVFQLALDSASAECRHYLGFDPEDTSSEDVPDLVIACCLLAAVHADVGDPSVNEYRRRAALRLMDPYRTNTGIGSA